MFQFGKLAIQSTVSMMGTAAIAAQGMTNTIENLNGIMAIGVGIGLMTVVGECMGAGRKDEAVYYVKKLSVIAEVVVVASCLLLFVLVRADHLFWRHGAGECVHVHLHGDLYYDCKTDCMDAGIYTGLRIPGGRRCSVFHGGIDSFHVDFPGIPCHDPGKSIWNGPDCGLDRHVYRLDRQGCCLFDTAEKQEMAGAQGDLISGKTGLCR